MYSLFLTHDHLCIPCLTDIFLFPYLFPKPLKLYTHVYTKTNVHQVLSDSHKYFTFVIHIFLHINVSLSIPCLPFMFVFLNDYLAAVFIFSHL